MSDGQSGDLILIRELSQAASGLLHGSEIPPPTTNALRSLVKNSTNQITVLGCGLEGSLATSASFAVGL